MGQLQKIKEEKTEYYYKMMIYSENYEIDLIYF